MLLRESEIKECTVVGGKFLIILSTLTDEANGDIKKTQLSLYELGD